MVEGGCQKREKKKKGVELSDEKGSRYFKIRGGGGGGGGSLKEKEEGWRKDAEGEVGVSEGVHYQGLGAKKKKGGWGGGSLSLSCSSKTQMLPGSVFSVSWIYFQV